MAEPRIGFEYLKIIDTLAAGKGEEHKGEDHLGVGPSLRRSKREMALDALAQAERPGKVQIEGKSCKSGNTGVILLFFILVRKDALWHN
jgi:hypothetical protein